MARSDTIESLVQQIRNAPNEALCGKLPEVAELAELGAPAVDALLRGMRLPTPAEQHPRDMIEALGFILKEIARRDPAPLLEVLDRDEIPPDPDLTFVVFALSGARPRDVVPHLLRAQRHRDVWVRWAAAEVLAGFGTAAVRAAMITALRDRSPMVKFVAVEALSKKKRLWSEGAVPLLWRIVSMPSVCKHSPGMLRMAQELLERHEAPATPQQNGPACAGPI